MMYLVNDILDFS
jgi:signal transduction histidine kinase